MRNRVAVWLCNLIMKTVATRTYRDRYEHLVKQKIAATLTEAMRAAPTKENRP